MASIPIFSPDVVAREVAAALLDAGCAVVRGVFDHTVLEQLRDELQPHVELADPEAGRAMKALYEAELNGLGYRDFYRGTPGADLLDK